MKSIDTQNLENGVKTQIDLKLLFDDGHQHINAEGDPDLCFDGVDGGTQETLGVKVALDPFEEEFDLPTGFVEGGDRGCRQGKVVGKKHQCPLSFRIVEANATQFGRIVGGAARTAQGDNLVATHAAGCVDGQGVEAAELLVFPRANHEEGSGLVDAVESFEIEITAIHDIEGAGFENQMVDPIDVVPFSLGHGDETGNGTAQIQQRIDLDGRLGGAKSRPRKQAQAQVDSSGIQCVSGGVEFHGKAVVRVELSGPSNQVGSQVGVEMPIAPFVGIGQCAATDSSTKSHVIKMLGTRTQTDLQIAQTLPKRQLSEGHAHKLIPTGKFPHSAFSIVTGHDTSKQIVRNVLHELGENDLASVHPLSLNTSRN